MTTDFTVRPARPTDARSLAAMRWAFKQEEHEGEPPAPARPLEGAEEWMRDRLSDGRWLAWVAETRDEICGHVFLCLVERVPDPYTDDAPVGYVTNFYVAPAQRGKGAGSALLEALTRHSRGSGLETLIAWPSERSSPLWRRSGFRLPEELVELPLGSR
ncbi:GNAT family N-acetyltransferase [Nocardiopsis trehalosi]|jgi:GNAT superfamily N-acetyltransferase|uniref:GNAT family N-acetyltransferase n=1 Tax=Nocardiopsis trehalosi TaxID=109329 RepID=UPI00082BFEA2|nr:GNAT family N-acetyltransferase [Nocardiopsis trehalosi]